ncbi:MAG: hypothetical protein QXQ13_06330 [Thermoplasmata archaeon]
MGSSAISAPPTRSRRNILVIASVLVVSVILVLWLVFVWPPFPKHEPVLNLSIDPASVSLPAGLRIKLTANARFGEENVSDTAFVRYDWVVSPSWLGDFEDRWRNTIWFRASDKAGEGNLTCTVTLSNYPEVRTANATIPIRVDAPFLAEAHVTPDSPQILNNQSLELRVIAHDSLGRLVSGFTAQWSIGGAISAHCELNRTTGISVMLTAAVPGSVVVDVAVYHEILGSISCNTTVEVLPTPPRAVSYRWYDMFDVPFGEWWRLRMLRPWIEDCCTDSYPYIVRWPGYGPVEPTFYGPVRLSITGRNMTEMNMNGHPVFLPYLGLERGGHAHIRWYMQYLTDAEMVTRGLSPAMNDGWIISLNGTVTLDEQAAKAVLNLTDDGYERFDDWWSNNSVEVQERYSNWLVEEAGPGRLDVAQMCEWPLEIFRFSITASKVASDIVLSYDVVTWGMEALMALWMHEAFMPTDWWFEDFTLDARIGPAFSDIDVDTAVQFALTATDSSETGEPCWKWEGMSQRMPEDSSQEYTPACFNLTAGEVLIFEWPDDEVMFMTHYSELLWSNFTSLITLGYSEPNQTDMPDGQCLVDLASHRIAFLGPFDFWTWSRDQTSHERLAEQWELLGRLPYGMPYLEFWPVA